MVRTLCGLASMIGRVPDRHRLRRQPHHATLAVVPLFRRRLFLSGGLGASLTFKGW